MNNASLAEGRVVMVGKIVLAHMVSKSSGMHELVVNTRTAGYHVIGLEKYLNVRAAQQIVDHALWCLGFAQSSSAATVPRRAS